MELHDLTAVEQASAIARGELSSVELTEHYLARTDRLNASVGAFVEVAADRALDQARAADSRRGREAFGPLDGVVVPVKDLNLVAGVMTRFGSAAVALVPSADDDVAAHLRAAGCVITGKTTTPEFGLPCYTEPDVGPWARTPWDLERSAGGSSGGAAAAVAAGLASAAQGSDGGGSIRIPASVCGLVGLKTSRGLVPSGPMPPSPGELAVEGPITRTVADAAALLDVLTGRSGPGSFSRDLDVDPPSLLIGRYCTPVIAATDVHPQCRLAYEHAAALLESLGHRVVDIDVPFPLSAVPHFEAVWAGLAATIPIPSEQEHLLRPLTRWLRQRGRELGFAELIEQVEYMHEHGMRAAAATSHLDAILTPTLADIPVAIGALRDDDDPAADFAAQKRFTPFTSPYNITGQPAITLPLHWTDDGLPVGVQLAGRPNGDAALLRLAGQIERAQPWATRHPEVW